ncbi:MAG TPA: TonB-dependent receptor [Bacteroidia bacterium]|jgi:iron complex outermembrane receptor protein|nr:TonB-dependent receptor [Bacteroidia bacterium]
MKKIFLIACAFFSAASFSLAQTTLKGSVKDSQTSQPVSGATVLIPHTTTAVSTDAQGLFTLQSASGFDSIYVSFLGYATQKLAIGDKSRPLDILLHVSSNQLGNVEVLGVRQAQSVTTLTEKDLNRASGLNLQDALNTVPGVSMSSRSPWGGQHIIIRGYYPSTDNGRTNGENFNGLGYSMYINDIPVTDASGTTILDDVDMGSLGKVEITKGPSPLFGSYIAGAVNLYTPRPTPNQTSIQEQVIGGSYGLFRSNTTIQTASDNSDLWINYGRQNYDGFRPHDNSNKDFVSLAANYYSSPKNTVSTYFGYSHSYEELAGEIDSAAFYGKKAVSDSNYVGNNSHVDIESYRAGFTDKYQFCKSFSSATTVFGSGSTLNQYFAHGFTDASNQGFGGRQVFTYESQNTEKAQIKGILGFSFQKSNQTSQGDFILPFIAQPPPAFSAFTGGMIPSDVKNYAMNSTVFTQWSLKLPSHITVTLGANMIFYEFGTQNLLTPMSNVYIGKPVFLPTTTNMIYLDYPTYTKAFSPVFAPNISVIKVVNDKLSVYANISEGYAPPVLSQMTNSIGQVDVNLKPEQAMQYEIGTKGTLGESKKFSYQFAVYDLDITNRLVSETANSITSYTNAGEERNLGAELYLRYNLIEDKNSAVTLVRPWLSYAYSNYTYVDFKNHGTTHSGADTVLNDYSGKKVAAVAPNVMNLGLDVDTKSGLYFHGTFQYVDKVPVTFDNAHYMNSYSLLGAKIGFKKTFGKITVNVFGGADNLLGSTYYSFIFVGQNIQELAQGNDPNVKRGGGDGYILPAAYKATFYGGVSLKLRF